MHVLSRIIEIKVISKTFGSHVIKVDESDIEKVNSHKWYIIKDHNKLYAASWERIGTNPRKYKPIKLHRFLLGITDSKIQVDHKNGDGLDNTRSNLRLATASQNGMNRPKDKTNLTGFKGVSFKKKHKKYSVAICARGKDYWGGHFDNAIDAAKRYNEMARELHGEFAYQNPV